MFTAIFLTANFVHVYRKFCSCLPQKKIVLWRLPAAEQSCNGVSTAETAVAVDPAQPARDRRDSDGSLGTFSNGDTYLLWAGSARQWPPAAEQSGCSRLERANCSQIHQPGHERGPSGGSTELRRLRRVEVQGVGQTLGLTDRQPAQRRAQVGVVLVEQDDTREEIRPRCWMSQSPGPLERGTVRVEVRSTTALSAGKTKSEDLASRSAKAISGAPTMIRAGG